MNMISKKPFFVFYNELNASSFFVFRVMNSLFTKDPPVLSSKKCLNIFVPKLNTIT